MSCNGFVHSSKILSKNIFQGRFGVRFIGFSRDTQPLDADMDMKNNQAVGIGADRTPAQNFQWPDGLCHVSRQHKRLLWMSLNFIRASMKMSGESLCRDCWPTKYYAERHSNEIDKWPATVPVSTGHSHFELQVTCLRLQALLKALLKEFDRRSSVFDFSLAFSQQKRHCAFLGHSRRMSLMAPSY